MLNLVMSIKPIPFKDIASGDKKIEFRFTFPKKLQFYIPDEKGNYILNKVYIYLIMNQRIVGKVRLNNIKILYDYFSKDKETTAIRKNMKPYEFDYLFKGGFDRLIYMYELGEFTKLDLPLSALGLTRAPQSWQYTEVEL